MTLIIPKTLMKTMIKLSGTYKLRGKEYPVALEYIKGGIFKLSLIAPNRHYTAISNGVEAIWAASERGTFYLNKGYARRTLSILIENQTTGNVTEIQLTKLPLNTLCGRMTKLERALAVGRFTEQSIFTTP